MTVPFLDLKLQYQTIKPEVDHAIASVFESGTFVGGKLVANFEKSFSSLFGGACVGVGNGTDALFVALKALGVGPGDEVITPALSWISTAETITLCGAKVVFADVDPEYFVLTVDTIESKVTTRTKAVLLVHLFGQAASVEEIGRYCKDRNLRLIEDCSQAHFSEESGKFVGGFGEASAFSFYPTKNLGAYGDAGCVVTNDSELEKKIRRFANHGGLTKDEHLFEGVNSRLDPIQAVVLGVKLQHIQAWTQLRIQHANLYSTSLRDLGNIKTPLCRSGTKHTFHVYAIRTKKRDALRDFLNQSQIQTMIHYPRPLPLEPAYRYLHHTEQDFPVSHCLCQELLSLPVFPELSAEQLEWVVARVGDFSRKHS